MKSALIYITHIEALIFAADQPISSKEIKECLESWGKEPVEEIMIQESIAFLKEKYDADTYAFSIVETAGGYQFLTKSEYAQMIAGYWNEKSRKRLSTAALEVLSIIAYKQPVTKQEVEQIRGVNCDHTIQKLLEKELITISGKSDAPGRPVLYSTSQAFMDYFGIQSPRDLPKLKDIETGEDNSIGEITPIDVYENPETETSSTQEANS